MCNEYFDERDDQQIRDEASRERRERERKDLKTKTDQQRREALISAEIDSDRRRGRRGLILSGELGDQQFGSNITATSAYSIAPPNATLLGG
jgi:hypothetical protein